MAAREDQAQHVVGDDLLVGLFRRLRLDHRLRLQLALLVLPGCLPANAVDRLAAPHLDQPGARIVRDAFGRPLRQRRRERILQRILRILEIAHEADQRRKRATRLGAKHVFDGDRSHASPIAQTGRTSTQP